FGAVISGNCGRNDELLDEARAGILSAVEAGESKGAIILRFGVDQRTVYKTIKRCNNHATVKSLPRSGHLRKLNRAQERMLVGYMRKFPKIKY
ncbi:hypothetical protein K432DRAFT_310933, partial [Lepidopterella palustris CBS 459.81]